MRSKNCEERQNLFVLFFMFMFVLYTTYDAYEIVFRWFYEIVNRLFLTLGMSNISIVKQDCA